MEAAYNKAIKDLNTRDQHIIHLESEILRIDYEYALIIKQLKEKYTSIAQESNNNSIIAKELTRENKKLNSSILAKQRENEQILSKVEDEKMKVGFQEEINARLKQENETLKKEIKYLEANQNKYTIKIQESHKKTEQTINENIKLQEKLKKQEKLLKKEEEKRKELEELLEEEVEQTKERVHNMGLEFTKTNQSYTSTKTKEEEYLYKTIPISNPEVLSNDWETDLKKLKNCLDYGNQYILVFDPMNLDRSISREIFKSIKKYIKEKEEYLEKYTEEKETNNKLIKTNKEILEHFEIEIKELKNKETSKITINTQIQTENDNYEQNYHKTIIHINDLNTKIKIKNNTLLECLELMALRSVAVNNMLNNSHINLQYFKKQIQQMKIQNLKAEESPKKCSLKSKLKSALNCVYFIEILKKNNRNNRKTSVNKNEKTNKIELETEMLKLERINNPELQKLKETLIINKENLFTTIEECIEYYEFKFKYFYQHKNINKELIL